MDIDHIFIFTDNKGKIADELVSFGWTEGNSRIHQGQGTANRVFSFENFFLEIVWVYNEEEIRSELVKPTGLSERANYRTNDFSRFGICLDNTTETDHLFKNAFKYQPEYFPNGMSIDMLTNNDHPDLPLVFRLPFRRERQKGTGTIQHKNGIKKLTGAQFTYIDERTRDFTEKFGRERGIKFKKASAIELTLTFDNQRKGQQKEFKELNLTIQY